MREDLCFFPLYTPDESLGSKKYYIIGIILFQIHLVVYVGSAYFIVWFYSPPALYTHHEKIACICAIVAGRPFRC